MMMSVEASKRLLIKYIKNNTSDIVGFSFKFTFCY